MALGLSTREFCCISARLIVDGFYCRKTGNRFYGSIKYGITASIVDSRAPGEDGEPRREVQVAEDEFATELMRLQRSPLRHVQMGESLP